jgi:hypothetical protein
MRLVRDVQSLLGCERVAARLAAIEPDRVELALERLPLADAMWSLPVIDALRRRYPSAALSVAGEGAAADLVRGHLGADPPKPGPGRILRVVLRADRDRPLHPRLEPDGAAARLMIPRARRHRGLPLRHLSAEWQAVARGLRLPVRDETPRLRLASGALRLGRALAARQPGRAPHVVLLPGRSARHAGAARLREIADLVCARFGGSAVELPACAPDAAAALLHMSALCLGDDVGWAHVAAAVGAPVVTLHGRSCPVRRAPASPRGAAAFTSSEPCGGCDGRGARRCLACLPAERVATLALRLAVAHWPRGTVRRWIAR